VLTRISVLAVRLSDYDHAIRTPVGDQELLTVAARSP
jgi:hypothetical protein